MARGFQAPLTYRDVVPGRPVDLVAAEELRPPGQPPAHHRRHPDLPDRPRLRAGDHRPRRRRGTSSTTGRRSSCPRAPTSSRSAWSRRPGCTPGPGHRPRGAVLPDVRAGQRRPGQRDGRRPEPHALDAGVRRRPRPRTAASRSRSTRWTRPEMTRAEEAGREDVPGRPPARPDDPAARRRGLGDVPRRQALDPAPDQPDARRLADPARRRAGAGRAARLAVHPAPPGVGPRPAQRRRHPGRGGRTGPVGGRRPGPRTLVGGGLVAAAPASPTPTRRTGGSTHERPAVGAPEQPGDRGRRASSTSWPCWRTWSSGARCAPCPVQAAAAGRRAAPARPVRRRPEDGTSGRTEPAAPPRRGDARSGSTCSAGSALMLTVIACAAHFVGLVGARHGRRPQPGALGQHVRVHDHGLVRGRRRLPAAPQALRPGVDGPDRHRHRARPADGGGALALLARSSR